MVARSLFVVIINFSAWPRYPTLETLLSTNPSRSLERPHAGNTLERLHFEKGCRRHAAIVAVVVVAVDRPLAKPMLLCTVMNRNISQIIRQTRPVLQNHGTFSVSTKIDFETRDAIR